MSLGNFLDPEPLFSAEFLISAQVAVPAETSLDFPSPHSLVHSISGSSCLHLHHPPPGSASASGCSLYLPTSAYSLLRAARAGNSGNQ